MADLLLKKATMKRMENVMHHHIFFLLQKQNREFLLSSYEIPEGEDKKVFSYASMKKVDYAELKKSEKFTPALYHEKDGIWEGGSISQFSPVMIFKLWESFPIVVWKYLKYGS